MLKILVKTLNDRIKLYNTQIDLERMIIDRTKVIVKDIENDFIRSLILLISKDCEKHALLLKALITLHTEESKLLKKDEVEKLAEFLQWHIQCEKQALDSYFELFQKVRSDKERLVIKGIYADENRHHKLLTRIQEIIFEKETAPKFDELISALLVLFQS